MLETGREEEEQRGESVETAGGGGERGRNSEIFLLLSAASISGMVLLPPPPPPPSSYDEALSPSLCLSPPGFCIHHRGSYTHEPAKGRGRRKHNWQVFPPPRISRT